VPAESIKITDKNKCFIDWDKMPRYN